MNRLIQRGLVRAAPAERWDQANRAGKRRGFVAENVAEKIGRQNHIKLLRAKHDLHCGVVHVEVIERDAGIFAGKSRDGLPPKR